MSRTVPLVHHQEFFTVHTTMVYVIQVCWLRASRIRTELYTARSHAVSKTVWHIPLLYVQWRTPDDGQRNCPKHVDFYSKNKFEKLVHLVGFIIRINHDARSHERQIRISKSETRSEHCRFRAIKAALLVTSRCCRLRLSSGTLISTYIFLLPSTH